MKLKGCHTIVTGAAGGIGRELCQQLTKRGALLLLVGRNLDKLQALATELNKTNVCAWVVSADISTTAGLEAIQKAVDEHWQQAVDMIIHSAGIMDFAAFETMKSDKIKQLTAINFEAPIQLTHRFLPTMLNQKQGNIVFIGSVLGALGMPYYSTYCASKFALRGFAESLRRELANTGIKITYVGPRGVKTALNNDSIEKMAIATKMAMDDPEWVATKIIKAISKDNEIISVLLASVNPSYFLSIGP